MIEKIFNDIFRIEIALPGSPLGATYSYFIRGQGRNLLIDTAFNRAECRKQMDQAVREIGFSMSNTDLFLTHVHSDHSGLAGYLAKPETKIYTGNYTAQILTGKNIGIIHDYKEFVIQSGLVGMGVSPYDQSIHPGLKYASEVIDEVELIFNGNIIDLGDVILQCIETSGHAPDHMCLYEHKRKILFSGDHILGKITPNNTIWGTPWESSCDYLGTYLKNLDKIALLDIELVLPGHRNILTDCYGRIEELKKHHEKRLNEILGILGNDRMNGAEIASKMKWNLRINSWDEFPPTQKLFAVGEALSHLSHLVYEKVLKKELCGQVVYYSTNTNKSITIL